MRMTVCHQLYNYGSKNMKLCADVIADKVRLIGRTLFDQDMGATFFNWTGSGFELSLIGTKVDIELVVQADYFPTEGTNLPWIAILIDEDRKPSRLIGLSEGTRTYTIYESRERETHRIRVIKRSENSKGRVGIKKIDIEGDILPVRPWEPRCRLEFIGDSITCGFGNETGKDNNLFSTLLENSFGTYSAIAADILGADYHSICISGIPLCKSYNENFKIVVPDFPDFIPRQYAMEDSYEYIDRYHQESNGGDRFEKWQFEIFRPDAIIVNLGTNDAFRVKASGNDPEEERHFEKRYKAFLYMLRRLNGAQPMIGCTLGPMDYYLYDNILRAVEAYQKETGDGRVFCYKFGGIFLWEEGIGALDHPSMKTHERMGKELVDVLKKWLLPPIENMENK